MNTPNPQPPVDKATQHIMDSTAATDAAGKSQVQVHGAGPIVVHDNHLVEQPGIAGDLTSDPSPPLSLEQIKAEVRQRHQDVVEQLDYQRSRRKEIDAKIRALVVEEQEARRMVKALEPRTRKAPKA